MTPGRIKIMEFDGDRHAGQATESAPARDGFKIVEFDLSEANSRQTVATPGSLKPIKIVEFDDDGDKKQRTQRLGSGTSQRRDSASRVTILEFDERNPSMTDQMPAGGSMKIREFD